MIKSIAAFFIFAGVFSLPTFSLLSMPADAGPRHIEVVAKRYAFDPASINLKKGEPVVLVLKSVDVPHGLRCRELNFDVKAPKGGSGEVQFTPDKTGDFVAHCSVFCGNGHGAMALTFHVSE
jgi:cytochrome c oxidase subunit II